MKISIPSGQFTYYCVYLRLLHMEILSIHFKLSRYVSQLPPYVGATGAAFVRRRVGASLNGHYLHPHPWLWPHPRPRPPSKLNRDAIFNMETVGSLQITNAFMKKSFRSEIG